MSNTIHAGLSEVTRKNPDGINRQKIIQSYLKPGQVLLTVPDGGSRVLGVYLPIDGKQIQIGTLTTHLSEIVQKNQSDGLPVTVRVTEITGGPEKLTPYRVAVEIIFGEIPEPEEIPAVSRTSIQQQMINITTWTGVLITGLLVALTFLAG